MHPRSSVLKKDSLQCLYPCVFIIRHPHQQKYLLLVNICARIYEFNHPFYIINTEIIIMEAAYILSWWKCMSVYTWIFFTVIPIHTRLDIISVYIYIFLQICVNYIYHEVSIDHQFGVIGMVYSEAVHSHLQDFLP